METKTANSRLMNENMYISVDGTPVKILGANYKKNLKIILRCDNNLR